MTTEKYTIQILTEGLDVFFSLCVPDFQPKTTKDISDELQLSQNKTYRILQNLEKREMVRNRNAHWEVSPEIVRISDGFRRHVANKRAEIEELNGEYIG